jgi:large subunit ribosomal protein L20
MPRVKRGTTHLKKRRKITKLAKGYRWKRSNLLKQAKTAVTRAGAFAYRDRRNKKRDFRRLWQVRINAAARLNGLSYSKFMNLLKKAEIGLDRKILSKLGAEKPKVFTKIVESVTSK